MNREKEGGTEGVERKIKISFTENVLDSHIDQTVSKMDRMIDCEQMMDGQAITNTIVTQQ